MSVHLHTLKQMQYISLPGHHKQFEMTCKGSVPPGMSSIYFTSFLRPTCHGFRTQLFICQHQSYIHCLKFGKKSAMYYFCGNFTAYYEAIGNTNYSWQMAYEFCRTKHMELPFFMSRIELDEFLRYVQRSDIIPFIEAIFISLRYNSNKVCLNYFAEYKL